jgi:hypothetical protein
MTDRDGLEIFGRQAVITDASGEQLTLHPLGLSDYSSCREEALDEYRRQQIRAWTKNADLMPDEQRTEWIREAFEKASGITYETLPSKDVEGDDSEGKHISHHVEYAMWWISSEPKGMLFALWLAAKKDPGQVNISIKQLEDRFMAGGDLNQQVLENAAQALGDISQPKIVGNGEAPPGAGRKRRRRRQRS